MKKYKIDELFTLIRNGANIKQDPNADGIPITRIETTSNDKFNRNKVGFANIYDPKPYENFILHDQDLLMSHINSEKYLGRSVLYNKKENECIIHGMNLLLLRANADIIIPRYINLYFKSATFKSKIAKITKKSVNQASFNVNSLKNIEVNIPELNEQAIIANKFDKLEALIEQNRLLLSKYDQLVKSQFIEMFGDPDLSQQKESWDELENVGEIVGGSTPKTSIKEYWDGDLNWFTPAEIKENDFIVNQSERKITELGAKSCSLRKMPINTVILSSRAPIGKVALAGCEFYCNQGFKNIVCNENLNPTFLLMLLKYNNEYLNSLGRGATFKEISKTIVSKIKIPTPPIELQNQFADFVKHIDKLKYNDEFMEVA